MYFSFIPSLVRLFISGGLWGEGDMGYLTITAQAGSRSEMGILSEKPAAAIALRAACSGLQIQELKQKKNKFAENVL